MYCMLLCSRLLKSTWLHVCYSFISGCFNTQNTALIALDGHLNSEHSLPHHTTALQQEPNIEEIPNASLYLSPVRPPGNAQVSLLSSSSLLENKATLLFVLRRAFVSRTQSSSECGRVDAADKRQWRHQNPARLHFQRPSFLTRIILWDLLAT